MNEANIKRGLKKHWNWIKKEGSEEVAKLVIVLGKKPKVIK